MTFGEVGLELIMGPAGLGPQSRLARVAQHQHEASGCMSQWKLR